MSLPKGLIVRVKCFALFFPPLLFYSSLCLCVFVFEEEEEECSYHHVPSASAQFQINKQDAFHYFLSAQSFVPSSHSEDAGLSMTLAAAWRLLADDRECLALLEVWLMGSVSLSGSLSTRRIAEGHCVWPPQPFYCIEMLLLTFLKS